MTVCVVALCESDRIGCVTDRMLMLHEGLARKCPSGSVLFLRVRPEPILRSISSTELHKRGSRRPMRDGKTR